MKYRIAELNAGDVEAGTGEAWWPTDGEWEAEDGAAAVQAWARATDAGGEGIYLAIPVDAIETVQVDVERRWHTRPVSGVLATS